MKQCNGKFSGNVDITSGSMNVSGTRTVNVNSGDETKIQNHVMGRSKLTGSEFTRLDLNKDGVITSQDYVLCKNILNGTRGKTFTDYVKINSSDAVKQVVVGTKNGSYENKTVINPGSIDTNI